MSLLCSMCGEAHDGMPQFFMWMRPECAVESDSELIEDSMSMGRIGNSQHFVRCEVEVPIAHNPDEVLGFICWVEISRSDYAELLAFRKDEDTAKPYEHLVAGRLANPVPCIAGSLGAEVKFQVQKEDPTPYVEWVAPDSPVARLIDEGASQEYWHEVAVRMGWRADA